GSASARSAGCACDSAGDDGGTPRGCQRGFAGSEPAGSRDAASAATLLDAHRAREFPEPLRAGDQSNVPQARLLQELLHLGRIVEAEAVARVGKLLCRGSRIERDHEAASAPEGGAQLRERHEGVAPEIDGIHAAPFRELVVVIREGLGAATAKLEPSGLDQASESFSAALDHLGGAIDTDDSTARDHPGHPVDEIATPESDLEDLVFGVEVQQLQGQLVHGGVDAVEHACRHEPPEQTRRLSELGCDELGETHLGMSAGASPDALPLMAAIVLVMAALFAARNW